MPTCNLHPAFASQQPPKRASSQKARPSHALSSLQPSRPITHLALELQSVQFTLSFHSLSFSIVFPWFYSISPSFYPPLQSPQVHVGGRTKGNRTPPSPNCHLIHHPQNRPPRPPQLGGEVPQKCPCFQPPPPRPPILTSFAMSNFAMLDSWLS